LFLGKNKYMENINFNELISNNILPVIPLRGKVAFPHTNISFEVGRSMTLKAVEKASSTDKIVFILTQRKTEKTDVSPDDLYSVGCVARIKQVAQLSGGALRVLCEGVYRAKARSVSVENGLFQAVAVPIFTVHGDAVLEEAYFRTAKALVKDVLSSDGKISKDTLSKLDQCENAEDYMDLAIANMRVRTEVKQRILEEDRIIERFKQFERCLNDELEIAKIEKKIADSVRQSIDKNQKEYFLREQLKAIHNELGDDGKEEDEYRAKVLEKHLPQDLETKCLKEIDRLGKMPTSSAEYTVITGYLDQVLALPWPEETQDTESLEDCVKELDADHDG
jgi:ATP-dependent Lon protease